MKKKLLNKLAFTSISYIILLCCIQKKIYGILHVQEQIEQLKAFTIVISRIKCKNPNRFCFSYVYISFFIYRMFSNNNKKSTPLLYQTHSERLINYIIFFSFSLCSVWMNMPMQCSYVSRKSKTNKRENLARPHQ